MSVEDRQPTPYDTDLTSLDCSPLEARNASLIKLVKRAKLAYVVVVFRRNLGRVLINWSHHAQRRLLQEQLRRPKCSDCQKPREFRTSVKIKGRVPKVQIKSTRGQKETLAKRPQELNEELLSLEPMNTAEHPGVRLRPATAKAANQFSLNFSTSPKRIVGAQLKSSRAGGLDMKRQGREVESPGVLSKSNTSLDIGTRLFLQAEELKLKKEQLRKSYEPEFSFKPNLTSKLRRKTPLSNLSGLLSPRVEEITATFLNTSNELKDQAQIEAHGSMNLSGVEHSKTPEYYSDHDPEPEELEDAIESIVSSQRATLACIEAYTQEMRAKTMLPEEQEEGSMKWRLENALYKKLLASRSEDELKVDEAKTPGL
jgi:hypothetical protein